MYAQMFYDDDDDDDADGNYDISAFHVSLK